MIAISFFLFALLVVAWLVMPGGERTVSLVVEAPALQTETQSV